MGGLFTFILASLSARPQVPVWWLSLAATLLSAMLMIAIYALMESVQNASELRELLIREQLDRSKDAEENARSRTAVVVAAEQPFAPFQSAKCVFIVDWSAQIALRPGTQVTIAIADKTHERPLGGGIVRPSQHDGKSVVTLDTPYEGTDQFILSILNKTSHPQTLSNIRIGPAIDLQRSAGGLAGVPVSSAMSPNTPPPTNPSGD